MGSCLFEASTIYVINRSFFLSIYLIFSYLFLSYLVCLSIYLSIDRLNIPSVLASQGLSTIQTTLAPAFLWPGHGNSSPQTMAAVSYSPIPKVRKSPCLRCSKHVRHNGLIINQRLINQPLLKSSQNHVAVISEGLEHAFLTGHRKTGFKSRLKLCSGKLRFDLIVLSPFRPVFGMCQEAAEGTS